MTRSPRASSSTPFLAGGDLVSAWFAAKDAATADWLWKKAMRENPPAKTYWEPSA